MSDPALDAALPAAPLAASGARPAAGVMANEQVLDVMRGFAALLVAFFHCRQVTWIGMGAFHRLPSAHHLFEPGTIAAWLTLPVAWGSAGVPIWTMPPSNITTTWSAKVSASVWSCVT